MSWLQDASDFVDQKCTAVRRHHVGIHSTKAVKASTAKVADLLATAVAIQQEDASAAGQIGYMARAMIWASLPHRKVEGAHYKRDNGLASITMLVDPDIGLPYGKLPTAHFRMVDARGQIDRLA